MIGARIKQARESAGLSLRALGERVGVTAMALSKYERDESTPSSKVLLGIAGALGVRTEYFFRGPALALEHVEHRKHRDLSDKDHNKVVADVTDQIERRVALGEVLPEAWSTAFDCPKLPARISDFDDIEKIADKTRAHWDLGSNPIQDLIDTLEEHGLKVFTSVHGEAAQFDGLSAEVAGMPVVVVGQGASWAGDRQRFTLAHELGHLLLEGRFPDTWDDKERERACDRFAGAFLAPRDEVFKALGAKRRWLEPRELLQLKHEFGLSMGAWNYRARDLGILSKQASGQLWGLFRKHGWHKQEPGEPYPQEIARRFTQLVYRALAEELLGESKAAELLGMSLHRLREERHFGGRPEEGATDAADQ